jgi:hypothetical protein
MKTIQLQRMQTLRFLSACVLLGMWLGLSPAWAQERGGVLRIGMTAYEQASPLRHVRPIL